jgi:hypothetical protein
VNLFIAIERVSLIAKAGQAGRKRAARQADSARPARTAGIPPLQQALEGALLAVHHGQLAVARLNLADLYLRNKSQ